MEKRKEIALNLKQFFDNQGIAQSNIAETLGVSRQYINGLLSGRNVIGKGIAEKIENHFGLSSAYLLTGKGSILNTTPPEAPASYTTSLPLIPINAMAGALTGVDISITVRDCEMYVVPIFSGADFLIRISGDSMIPKYAPGDIVACRRVSLDRLWFQWGKVYVIDTKQGALLKRIEPSGNDGYITLCSYNQLYKPFDIPVEDINGIAIVIGVIRTE